MGLLRISDPPKNRLLSPPVFFGSLGLVGFAPFARGTFGTLACAAAAVAWLEFAPWGPAGWYPLALLFAALSWVLGAWALRILPAGKDPGWFVLDEAAGYFLALGLMGADSLLEICGAFVTFRLYDIAKPWPVRSFEQIPGSLGILTDDLAAAVLAAWTWQAGLILIAGFA